MAYDVAGLRWDSLGRARGALGLLTWATRYARTRGGQNADFTYPETEKQQVSDHSRGPGWAPCKTVG
jgi:hypothetical protein